MLRAFAYIYPCVCAININQMGVFKQLYKSVIKIHM